VLGAKYGTPMSDLINSRKIINLQRDRLSISDARFSIGIGDYAATLDV